jgi:hypothetical protein
VVLKMSSQDILDYYHQTRDSFLKLLALGAYTCVGTTHVVMTQGVRSTDPAVNAGVIDLLNKFDGAQCKQRSIHHPNFVLLECQFSREALWKIILENKQGA